MTSCLEIKRHEGFFKIQQGYFADKSKIFTNIIEVIYLGINNGNAIQQRF